MFDKFISPALYLTLSAQRSAEVTRLLIKALEPVVPNGYVLSAEPEKIPGNAVIALRPIASGPGDRMICFIHAINYRHQVEAGEIAYRPTMETIRAVGSVRGATLWYDDDGFGKGHRIVQENRGGLDLPGMVRDVVSEVCTGAPFVNFEWRKCADDPVGRWDLMDGSRPLQSVIKTGSRFSTDFGPCPTTLRGAKDLAEAVARAMIRTAHEERLAGLGDEPDDQHEDEHEFAMRA